MSVCGKLTSVWNEGDLQEGTDHAGDVARLVVSESLPLVHHQTVHGYPHVSIARERRRRRMKQSKKHTSEEWSLSMQGYIKF